MSPFRRCSRTACPQPAAATLTYVQADSTVVLGPLAGRAEPGAHDLCRMHADRFTPPRSWHVIRLESAEAAPERSRDDLLAIADAVREAARPVSPQSRAASSEPRAADPGGEDPGAPAPEAGPRRGHLRVLRSGPDT